MRNIGWLCVLVVGCGGSSGKTPDATNVPATITVTGTAAAPGLGGSTPAPGVAVGAFRNSDENTAVAMATTDGSGNYTLTITTNGQPLDGFVKATKSGYETIQRLSIGGDR